MVIKIACHFADKRLAVVLQSVFQCWVYRIISSSLSHLWCVVLSPQIYWCLACVGCCDVGTPQVFLGGKCEAPRSHIPIGVNWWECWGIWGTCCNFWCLILSRIWWGIPLTHFLLLCVRRCRIFTGESMRCSSPSTWSAWWRWKILLSLWWSLFLCTWYILCLNVCASVSHFISF